MDQGKFERMMYLVIKNSILPMEFFNDNSVHTSSIEEMYYNDEISEEEIINNYNSNLFGEEAIELLFGQDYDRMIERIEQGNLSIKALKILPIEVR